MKLLKWAIGGASAYVVYRYSIGRKAKGEPLFATPEKALEKIAAEAAPPVRKRAARKPAAEIPAGGDATVTAGQEPGPAPKSRRKNTPRKVDAAS